MPRRCRIAYVRPPSQSANAIPSATEWNQSLRSNWTVYETHGHTGAASDGAILTLAGLGTAWAAYVPTWAGLVIGNATVVARWAQVGKLIFVHFEVVFGTTTTYSGEILTTLPALSNQANLSQLGSAWGLDSSSGGAVTLAVHQETTGTMGFYLTGAGGAFKATNTVPWTWATSDAIRLNIMYEAA